MPTAAPSRSTRSAGPDRGAGRRLNRSSGICPERRRKPPEPPVEHLPLGQRVHRSRGEDRQQRAVDDADVVGRRRSPAPLGRHRARRRAPRRRQRRRISQRRDRAQRAQQEARRRCLALVAAGRSGAPLTGPRGPPRRPTRATTRSMTSSRVYGVVSMCDGAVGHGQRRGRAAGVDLVAREQGLLGGGDVGAALLGGAPGGAGVRVGGEVDLDLRRRATTTEPMSRPSTTIPPRADDLALELEQPGAHLGHGADRADGGGDVVAADRRRRRRRRRR